ncbi:MAG: hypothetical protein WA821_06360, partial [Anaerolineales bacterium]
MGRFQAILHFNLGSEPNCRSYFGGNPIWNPNAAVLLGKRTATFQDTWRGVRRHSLFSYLTLLQLLDSQKLHIIPAHFDDVFGRFHENFAAILCLFANFTPLSSNENGEPTFLQWS